MTQTSTWAFQTRLKLPLLLLQVLQAHHLPPLLGTALVLVQPLVHPLLLRPDQALPHLPALHLLAALRPLRALHLLAAPPLIQPPQLALHLLPVFLLPQRQVQQAVALP
jgi:hypothetical protein